MAILIKILLFLLSGPLCAFAQITLQLDSEHSPPATIPSDPMQQIYNAPAMDHMLEPVIVNILDSNGDLVTESVTVIATSILAAGGVDSYEGELCMHNKWTHRFFTCRFNTDNCIEMYCNNTDPDYPFGKIEVVSEDGVATFHRLLHTLPSTNGQRKLQFYAEVNGSNATVESNAFDVDSELTRFFIHSHMQLRS